MYLHHNSYKKTLIQFNIIHDSVITTVTTIILIAIIASAIKIYSLAPPYFFFEIKASSN